MKVLHVSTEGQEQQTGKIQGQRFSKEPVTDLLVGNTRDHHVF